MKKIYDLTERFADILPSHKPCELRGLTESILKYGCLSPIVVWNGAILDGHARYRICREHNIPFEILEQEMESDSEAICWIIMNQLGKRNIAGGVEE